jgi:hypothetical protein
MITIFTIPKPFINQHISLIQHNAIRSWLALGADCEIILFGNEDGIESTAKLYNIQHVNSIDCNEYGTPLLSDAFDKTQKIARNEKIMYLNADIIIVSGLLEAIQKINISKYLICGRRYDIDVRESIDLRINECWGKLNRIVQQSIVLHGYSGIDYFLFPKGQITMPPFLVGRPGWDNWLIWRMRMDRIPVIDATHSVAIYHQNHNYSHSKFAEKKRVGGPEMMENMRLAGGTKCFCTLRDSDYVLVAEGVRRKKFPNNLIPMLSLFPLWACLLAIKRILQQRLQ